MSIFSPFSLDEKWEWVKVGRLWLKVWNTLKARRVIVAKNIWTTIGGFIAGLPMIYAPLEDGMQSGDILKVISGLGVMLLGLFAKQFNVTGGTKPQTPEAEARTK